MGIVRITKSIIPPLTSLTNSSHRTEMWTILMVSCIPPIRPLFMRAIQQIQSSSNRSRNTNNSQVTPGYPKPAGPYASLSNVKRPTITTTNESEEDILADRDGIRMTRKVSIHYNERASNHRSENNSE